MATYIWVAPGPELRPGQCAISERDPRHPLVTQTGLHEVFLAHGRAPIQVGRTALVTRKLRHGELVEVAGPAASHGRGAGNAGVSAPAAPDRLNRADLNAYALAHGIADPTTYERKADLLVALMAAADAGDTDPPDDDDGDDDGDDGQYNSTPTAV